MTLPPTRRVLAHWDGDGVTVYQAFEPRIVRAAVEKGTFGVGFGRDRMTWIKPSFGWMLHRSGYAAKHGQEAVARVRLSHEGFRAILAQSVPTLYDLALFGREADWQDALARSEVRCQWDPDRDLQGRPLARRAIQLGFRGVTVHRYVDEWILSVEDVTELARAVGVAARSGSSLPDVPAETEYPVDAEVARILGYD
ncbi:MAG TPA: DUF4291 domain-containing protein [Armatimonadaceae bacterium]|jgi:hypothetical protein|nr:DUF4291 domain-containing protein [Armatimonadaceae bacterium]